jgi:tetratricopeptide (TPR) repeat protein
VFCRKAYFLGLSALLIFSLTIASCLQRSVSSVARLAVLPLEDLGLDSQVDSAGHAAAAAIAYDLDGLTDRYAQAVESISGAYSMHASQILEGYYFERNGRVAVVVEIESVARRKTVQSIKVEGPAPEGVLPLVNEVAKRLSARARPFGTNNTAAFRAYGEAVAAPDRAVALQDLESATQADPGFGAAYIARGRILLAAGQRDQARQEIQAGEASRREPIEQAKLEYLSALVSRDTGRRKKILEVLTHLTPADLSVYQERAELELSERNFQGAARDYEATTRLDPNESERWNRLGYVLAYAHDAAGARRALEHYQGLLPRENANALDSLGEVNFYLGDFAKATAYFLEAQKRNPDQFGGAELLKAAQAKLMTGDLRDGDGLFQQYIASGSSSQRANAGLEQAQWEFLTGRRKAGVARLEKLVQQLDSDGRSIALCQLSIWKLETGDSKTAAVLATQAGERAVSVETRNLSELCRFLATTPKSKSGSALVDAYALIFARKFREALPLLQSLYVETNPLRDGQIRTLLAWAYVETGRIGDANRLLGAYPIPLSSGESVFASLIFPRYLFLKAVALGEQGSRGEAKRSYELFLKYAGDVPDIFSDGALARQKLSTL